MIILLVIGYLIFVFYVNRKNLTVSVMLIIIVISLSFFSYFNDINLTNELVYSIFLPGLLFLSAYQFSARALKKHRFVIGFLSTIGLILTVGLLGIIIYFFIFYFVSISILSSLLLAAILTLTDPVSVISFLILSSNYPGFLRILAVESMINDGTSIVLFTVLLDMYTRNESFHFFDFIKSFFFVSFGGIILGLIVGWSLSKLVHLFNERYYQVMLSIVIAYGSFHLAEH